MARAGLFPFILVSFLLGACALTPDADPSEDAFQPEDYALWASGSRSAPDELLGVWRVLEVSGNPSGLRYYWYRFDDEGIFAAGAESYFKTGEGRPEWEGAFRVKGDVVICHYQLNLGDDAWLEEREGRGTVREYPFFLNDRNTLTLGGQTSQNLSVRYKRAQ